MMSYKNCRPFFSRIRQQYSYCEGLKSLITSTHSYHTQIIDCGVVLYDIWFRQIFLQTSGRLGATS
jgi:hypothetical protein